MASRRPALSETGTAHTFSYDVDGALTVVKGGCTWSLGAAMHFAAAAAAATQQSQTQTQQELGGFVQQGLPDQSYVRVPRDLPQLLAAGLESVTFEAGTVLRCVVCAGVC